MPIQLLPPRLANQIAAGEVVERPASVVKELVENSLDAGATKIELDIERGGHKRIKLTDNGCGIARDELELALSRHATSKITDLDDLENIASLGFRGEALASISSVSRLTLTSKPVTQDQAWEAHCEGREMAVTVLPAAHPQGTTIDVVDLFYNTPARRKFLRTEKTEYQHIEDVIKRIALSRPLVTFVLKHNGTVTKRFTKVVQAQLDKRIAQVCGQRFVANALALEADYNGVQLKAWLGNHNVLRSSTDCQFSFVNGRGMRDKLILHGIRQAYEATWGVVEQPSFVFYLDIAPSEVDVNVHPAKHEVRFHQSRLIHDFIVKSVSEALASEQGSIVAEPAAPEPAHDYIRPLQSSPSEPAASWQQGQESQYPNRDAGSNTSVAGVPSSRPSAFGGMSVGRGDKVTAQYSGAFKQLMTTSSNATISSPIAHMALSSRHRLYQEQDAIWLVDVQRLAASWAQGCLTKPERLQPLLMPVMVQLKEAADDTLVLLRQIGFVVDVVAGKLRLQQVPANMRSWPWVKLLPAILDNRVHDQVTLMECISSQKDLWQSEHLILIWKWLDESAIEDQWALIKEFGRVQNINNLIQAWS